MDGATYGLLVGAETEKKKTLKEVNHKRMREAVTDRALEFPRASPSQEPLLALHFPNTKRKKKYGIRNKPETYPINLSDCVPRHTASLKSKALCVGKAGRDCRGNIETFLHVDLKSHDLKDLFHLSSNTHRDPPQPIG